MVLWSLAPVLRAGVKRTGTDFYGLVRTPAAELSAAAIRIDTRILAGWCNAACRYAQFVWCCIAWRLFCALELNGRERTFTDLYGRRRRNYSAAAIRIDTRSLAGWCNAPRRFGLTDRRELS